ncbi:hypothetical protein HC931_05095 [Candidatus Gracilibacteria bacterium]|jgi:hypothetical protein|nr:hypothetical protein [Candidatus Gracilibacteria bacterium]NJM88844.1 hypothetical protein [Hydrococcus sp. RU_2_2]NJP18225.1 hypothetical protein [Hydrococcus sp. CRU_1_1]
MLSKRENTLLIGNYIIAIVLTALISIELSNLHYQFNQNYEQKQLNKYFPFINCCRL